MTDEGGPRRKVAILGGGAGGLAAAWELTATPELADAVDVTVHQLGWRLGGKGASGRNAAAGNRIEEHGLHIWFGWYQHAFEVMRSCYDELPGDAPQPFPTWREAFSPFARFVLMEEWCGHWFARGYEIPIVEGDPFDPRPPVQDADEGPFRAMVEQAHRDVAEWLSDFVKDRVDDIKDLIRPSHEPELAERAPRLRAELEPEEEPGLIDIDFGGLVVRLLERTAPLQDALLHAIDEHEAAHADATREEAERDPVRDIALYTRTLDFFLAVASGTKKALEDGDTSLSGLDEHELRPWLVENGMTTPWQRVPFLRGAYDLTFAYPRGNRAEPDMAAGVTVRNLLAMLVNCRGGFMWKMNTGMGDAIFAPLYHVLRQRGVKFEFFNWIDEVALSDDGAHVARIVVKAQATPVAGEYEPLVDVDGTQCWPSEPRWSELVDGEALEAAGAQLEMPPGDGVPGRALVVGEDFDDVVLALPAGVHASVCAGLRADPRFDAMVETWERNTVMTRALQLWLGAGPDELGAPELASVAGAYDAEFDTIADMCQVLERESWPPGGPKYLAYLCSVLPEPAPAELPPAQDPVLAPGTQFDEETLRKVWAGFALAHILAPDGRYFRRNLHDHERYVLSRAGDVRLRLDQTYDRYPNLVLAGDWTRTGIDAGCVEAAVLSGRRAGKELLSRR